MSAALKPTWSAAAQWLGRQLAGGPVPLIDVTVKAKADGIPDADLMTAMSSLPGVERCAGAWALSAAWREYWRGFHEGAAAGDQAVTDARRDIAT